VPQFSINGETFFSTKDVADLLGIAPSTLRALLGRGVLPDVPRQTHVTRKQRGFTEAWVRADGPLMTDDASGR
jgi:predicted transcriptional regulator of viral defense system